MPFLSPAGLPKLQVVHGHLRPGLERRREVHRVCPHALVSGGRQGVGEGVSGWVNEWSGVGEWVWVSVYVGEWVGGWVDE